MKFDELFMKDEVRVVTRVHGIQWQVGYSLESCMLSLMSKNSVLQHLTLTRFADTQEEMKSILYVIDVWVKDECDKGEESSVVCIKMAVQGKAGNKSTETGNVHDEK